MSKIKSVLSIAVDILKLNSATYLDDEMKVAEYGEKLQRIITQDRQAFEEAIVEALEGIKNNEVHLCATEVIDGVTVSSCPRFCINVEHNQAIDQAIATVRAIYQGNK